MKEEYLVLGAIIFIAIAGYLAYSYFKPSPAPSPFAQPDAVCNGKVEEEWIKCSDICPEKRCKTGIYSCTKGKGCVLDDIMIVEQGKWHCYKWTIEGKTYYNKQKVFCVE